MTAPTTSPPRILVVEDEADIRAGLVKLLGRIGPIRVAADGVEALRLFALEPADIVVTDLRMPRMSGSELLTELRAKSPGVQVVIVTGFGTIQTAVACLRAGAAHFLTKPFDNEEVRQVIERLAGQVSAARARAERVDDAGIVAEDPSMRDALDLAARAAKSPVPVLIEGESGAGKEVIARFIHGRSAVAARRFLAVNAAALPDTLLESELFGCKKGAFTGADRDRDGLFVEAQGGTVFLDEIASMSPPFQGKLLRVLQERTVRPLGGARDVTVDFRLIVATNRDLVAMTKSGEFREDLYYRLSVIRVFVPPLRERPRDVEPLARLLLDQACRDCLPSGATAPRLSEDALTTLRAHAWPGNVRELENAMKRAVVVCSGETIEPHHLGLLEKGWGSDAPEGDVTYEAGKQRAVERFQREFVQRALERTGGNVSQAAERCGMTRAALQRIMQKLGIDRASF